MADSPRPGYVPNYVNYPSGAQPATAASWQMSLFDAAKTRIMDAVNRDEKVIYIKGLSAPINLTDIKMGGQISPTVINLLSNWAMSDATAADPDIVNDFMKGTPRPPKQPDDWVPTAETQARLDAQAKQDLDSANRAAEIMAMNANRAANYASAAAGGFGRSTGVTSSGGGGEVSADAQLAATLRREELAYQREKDNLDRQMQHAQIVAQLGANPGDAVQREIFLRTGMEPVGRVTNAFTGQQGPGYATLSQNMQNMTDNGVFGQNPTLPAGQAPFVPYVANGPGYANGTEITPDGWTTAQTFIAGDPQKPWQVNPEKIELRVVDGKPQAKVTPIKGPQYTQIASMGHAGGLKYPWGTEGDTDYAPATSPYPTTGTNPATPGTDGSTPAAPAFDPTKQYMDKDGRIRSYSEQQLSGLSQSAWDSQQLDAQRKAGTAAALLQNKRFTSGITAEQLKTLQDMANTYDPWLFQRLKQRYRPEWDSGDMTKVFDPNLVGFPVLAPPTRTRGAFLPGTPPPAAGTPPAPQPAPVYWGNRSPGWGGGWTAPSKPIPLTPPPSGSTPPAPTTPPLSAPAWGTEGNTSSTYWGGSQNRNRPNYANGTVPMYADSTDPFPSWENREFWTETVDGKQHTQDETVATGEFAGMTYGDAYKEMMQREYLSKLFPQGLDYSSLSSTEQQAWNISQLDKNQAQGFAALDPTHNNVVAAPDPNNPKKTINTVSQSMFQWGDNYVPGSNLPTAPGATPVATGTTADPTKQVAKFGNTGLSTGVNQFAADSVINYADIDPTYLPYIQVWDPVKQIYTSLAPGQSIAKGQTVYINIPTNTQTGLATAPKLAAPDKPVTGPGTITFNLGGTEYVRGAASFGTPVNGMTPVTGPGYVPVGTQVGNEPVPVMQLQVGDYKLADGSYVRYNKTLGMWMPVDTVAPVYINSEAQFLALPDKTRNDILTGKPTGYVLNTFGLDTTGKRIQLDNFKQQLAMVKGVPVGSITDDDPEVKKYIQTLTTGQFSGVDVTRQQNPDWLSNYFAGLNSFTPRPKQITQEEFNLLPNEVQQALIDGTPMPEGYEQYGKYAGNAGAFYPGTVPYTNTHGTFMGTNTGLGVFGQPVTTWKPFNFTSYQNQSSPPGPAMPGYQWVWVDDNTGQVTKRVRK